MTFRVLFKNVASSGKHFLIQKKLNTNKFYMSLNNQKRKNKISNDRWHQSNLTKKKSSEIILYLFRKKLGMLRIYIYMKTYISKGTILSGT